MLADEGREGRGKNTGGILWVGPKAVLRLRRGGQLGREKPDPSVLSCRSKQLHTSLKD